MNDSDLKAEKFLTIASQYKLGKLITESSHPDTRDLSYLALNNLPEAIAKLKELDNSTIEVLSEKVKQNIQFYGRRRCCSNPLNREL